jgi:hypothetical protein
MSQGECCRIRLPAGVDLGVGIGDVPFHGANAEDKRLGDLGVGPSGRDERQYFYLSLR